MYIERQYYDSLWEQDRQKKIQREEQDRLLRHESNQKMIQALTEQLSQLKSQAQREAHQKEFEGRLMVKLNLKVFIELETRI